MNGCKHYFSSITQLLIIMNEVLNVRFENGPKSEEDKYLVDVPMARSSSSSGCLEHVLQFDVSFVACELQPHFRFKHEIMRIMRAVLWRFALPDGLLLMFPLQTLLPVSWNSTKFSIQLLSVSNTCTFCAAANLRTIVECVCLCTYAFISFR